MRHSALLAVLAVVAAGTSARSLDAGKGPPGTFRDLTIGRFTLAGVAPLNTTYATVKNPNAIVAGPGNSVSFCPALSCVYGPPNGSVDPAFADHQRASLLVSATTQDDAHSEEQTVAITTTVATGHLDPYAPNRDYVLNANVAVGNAVYRAVQAGRSSASSPLPATRPTSLPFVVQDGTVRWQWINDAAIASKVGLYNEVRNVAGGGNSWAQANNFELDPGHKPHFNINSEFDFTNNSGVNCEFGINCINLYVAMGGSNTSSAGINVLSNNTDRKAAIWGIRLNGPWLAREAALAIDANSKWGIAANQFGLGGDTFTEGFILDNSNAPKSIAIAGVKSIAAIEDKSNGAAGLSLSGKKSLASIYDSSASLNGISLNGAYSGSQIVGSGWNVNPSGVISVSGLSVTGITYESAGLVPPTSSTPCAPGQRSWDTNYEYRCISQNQWKRAALSSW